MKKFLFLIILFFLTFQQSFAEDIFKITATNFDTSNSMIVMNIPDQSTQPVLNSVKLVQLDNPQRVYFDIPSAILTIPKQEWNLNSKQIKSVKISQFNTNTVRVVLYPADGFNPSTLKILRIKNNIIIKIKNPNLNEVYFNTTYRDEHSSPSDFYESLTVEVPQPQDNMVNQIQQAFNNTVSPKLDAPAFIKKKLKLNTKFYLNKVTPKPNSVLLSGFGAITIEKPLILENPSRIVFDIPNTVVSPDLKNQQYQLSETDTVKIGQFEINKARIVIITPDVTKYIPVFSTDSQSVLLANVTKLNYTSLFTHTSDIIAYKYEKSNPKTSALQLSFNHPVVHAVNRTNSMLTVYLYNVKNYNEEEFNNAFKNTRYNNLSLLPNIGMKLNIPITQNSSVKVYLGADSKTLKIQITDPTSNIPKITSSNAKKIIVLDPGHGGDDCGALRNNIEEKEIVLDVSKRVRDLLIKKGYQVEMTRDTDKTVSLQDRVEFSEKIQPNIFVSIHVNSCERPEITGIETHYYHQESMSLAQTIQESLISSINSKNRGLFKSKFYVINHTSTPAILIEIGFLSNDGERAELISEKRKQDTAKAIAEGIQNYFKQ